MPSTAYSLSASKRFTNTYKSDRTPPLFSSPGVGVLFCALLGLPTVAREPSMTQTLTLCQPTFPAALCPLPQAHSPPPGLPPARLLPLSASTAQDPAWLIPSGLRSGVPSYIPTWGRALGRSAYNCTCPPHHSLPLHPVCISFIIEDVCLLSVALISR